jgi:hypothetical protein
MMALKKHTRAGKIKFAGGEWDGCYLCAVVKIFYYKKDIER